MTIHYGTEDLPLFEKAVITTGMFDGVHHGHREIVRGLIEEADRIAGTPVVISFDPHPSEVVRAGSEQLFVLSTIEEKAALLAEEGLRHLVVIPFTRDFAALSPAEYISKFLVTNFQPAVIVTGYDHRFGKGREGDYLLLEDKAAEFGYTVKEISKRVLQEAAVSSTRIRESLLTGNIEAARELMGHTYSFNAMVIEGNKLGRTIGYPTANLFISHPKKLIPGNAVYAVKLMLKGRLLYGMMNIGVRPTIGGAARVIEANIFEFDEDIYGEEITVFVIAKLRDEQKFTGLEQLKQQLGADQLAAQKILKQYDAF